MRYNADKLAATLTGVADALRDGTGTVDSALLALATLLDGALGANVELGAVVLSAPRPPADTREAVGGSD